MNAYVGSAGTVGEAWPHVQQIAVLRRERTQKGQTQRTLTYLITSLPPKKGHARRLLRLSRQYWRIENQLHWRRDVVLGEDGSPIRSGSAPEVMAALRSLCLTLVYRLKLNNAAAAFRTYAARPKAAVAFVLSRL